MRTRLLISVSTIALLAGAGIASAQDKGGGMGGGGASQAPQQSSPAQQSAPPANRQGGGDMKGGSDMKGGAEMKGGADTKGGQAEQMDKKGDQKGDRPQRAQDTKGDQKNDQKGAQDQRNDRNQKGAQDRDDKKGSNQKDADDTKSRRDSTTGQGAAGSKGASITTEQRTKITTTIKQTNVRPVTNVNINVRVGSAIPRTVTLNPLPATVIEVYPDWRGYRFILVRDEILVIDPDTYEIVAVLDA